MTIWIYTGDKPSNGAKALAAEEGFKRLRVGKFLKPGDTIVNWGTSKVPLTFVPMMLNVPQAVARAANKCLTFAALAGEHISTVPWTSNMAVAKEWLESDHIVMVRQKLTGHSGDGIIIVEKVNELVEAPLYTKYIFKVREFRVHATPNQIIDTQRKVRDPNVEPVTWKVRSHANGFIFQRKNIPDSPKRDELAMKAVSALGLDFGAVDIVEDKKGNFYILEVNSAPGLEGQTVLAYTEALKELADAKNA